MSIKELIDLYKIHNNPDASIVEIHWFLMLWGIPTIILREPRLERIKIQKQLRDECMELCKTYILKNSKLHILRKNKLLIINGA